MMPCGQSVTENTKRSRFSGSETAPRDQTRRTIVGGLWLWAAVATEMDIDAAGDTVISRSLAASAG